MRHISTTGHNTGSAGSTPGPRYCTDLHRKANEFIVALHGVNSRSAQFVCVCVCVNVYGFSLTNVLLSSPFQFLGQATVEGVMTQGET